MIIPLIAGVFYEQSKLATFPLKYAGNNLIDNGEQLCH